MKVNSIKNSVKSLLSSSLFKGVFVLSSGGVICKVIGAVYRIPLASIIGAYGMGIYQMIYPLYALLLVFSSSGVPLAISKIISRKIETKEYDYIRKMKNVALKFACIIGLIFAFLLIVSSVFISTLQGVPSAYLGYIIIAPSIFFVCLISVYRGFFQGENNMKPTSVSQVMEQLIKLIFGVLLAYIFGQFGVIYGVAGGILGVTTSELFAFVYLRVKFRKTENAYDYMCIYEPKETKKQSEILKDLLKESVPFALSNILIPLVVCLESFFFINLLSMNGGGVDNALSTYGVYSGIVCVLINVPICVASTIGVALLPIISKCEEKNIQAKHLFNGLKIAFLISLFSIFAFIIFSNLICSISFPLLSDFENNLAVNLLKLSSFSILFLSVFYVCLAFLQGVKSAWAGFNLLSIIMVCRIIFEILALYYFSVYEFVLVSILSALILCVLFLIMCYKYLISKGKVKENCFNS